MDRNPGQKVKTDRLQGAYRKLHMDSWECIGCGETRKRREQVAHHIRGTHLDNRGFYHCDEPGWYVIFLRPSGYTRLSHHLAPLAPLPPTHSAT
jgi:hypothetical protein